MKFKLEIDLGNDAMCRSVHVADALITMGRKIINGTMRSVKKPAEGIIRDINGNSVGKWELIDNAKTEGPI